MISEQRYVSFVNRNKELLEAAFKLLKLITSVFIGVVIAIWSRKLECVWLFFNKCRGFSFLKNVPLTPNIDVLRVKLRIPTFCTPKLAWECRCLCLDKLLETKDARLNQPVHMGVNLKLDTSIKTEHQRCYSKSSAFCELLISFCGFSDCWELIGLFSILPCLKPHCTWLYLKLPQGKRELICKTYS